MSGKSVLKGCGIAAGAGFLLLLATCTVSVFALRGQRERAIAKSKAESAQAQTSKGWAYRASKDEMGRGDIRTASVESTNTFRLDFPYQGEQHATLDVRSHPKFGKDIILRIERGQFNQSVVDGCDVQIRFDDENPFTVHASAPSDNSSESIFLNGFSKLLPKLKASKRCRIEAPMFQHGNLVFDFDVHGLRWE